MFDYHVVFTTPYVLINATKTDWTAYLRRATLGMNARDPDTAIHEFLKYGHEPTQWSEFVLLGYHHHQPNAIFLAGLPDVKGSLPHAHQ